MRRPEHKCVQAHVRLFQFIHGSVDFFQGIHGLAGFFRIAQGTSACLGCDGLDPYTGRTALDHPDFLGGLFGKIDDAILGKGAAVIDGVLWYCGRFRGWSPAPWCRRAVPYVRLSADWY